MKATEFGRYIRDLRNQQKLTTRQLEAKSGVSNSYISQIENGKRIPAPHILQKLAPALNIAYEELLKAAGHLTLDDKIKVLTHSQYMALIKALAKIAYSHLTSQATLKMTEKAHTKFLEETLKITNGQLSPDQINLIKTVIEDIEVLDEKEIVVYPKIPLKEGLAAATITSPPPDVSLEDIELIRKLKKLSPEKRKAIEVLMGNGQ